jgi:Mrp family chromosome partitioning ATPase
VPPHALLAHDRLTAFVEALRPTYEFIVFDTPAVLRFPDALNLARVAEGMLLVVSEGSSVRAQEETRRRLQRVDAKVLGAVLNRVPPREFTAL